MDEIFWTDSEILGGYINIKARGFQAISNRVRMSSDLMLQLRKSLQTMLKEEDQRTDSCHQTDSRALGFCGTYGLQERRLQDVQREPRCEEGPNIAKHSSRSQWLTYRWKTSKNWVETWKSITGYRRQRRTSERQKESRYLWDTWAKYLFRTSSSYFRSAIRSCLSTKDTNYILHIF